MKNVGCADADLPGKFLPLANGRMGSYVLNISCKYWREIMPIFEYNCEHCKYKFDLMVTTHKAQVKCPLCQGKVKKLMSSFNLSV
jgi:putative FmdB family regulatory protein